MTLFDMYFEIGSVCWLIFITMQFIFVMKYLVMAATIKEPKASELTIFGCKTWFLVADDDFDADIGYNLFFNAFLFPLFGGILIFFGWLPIIIVAIPTYLVYSARKRLFG